MRKIQSRSGECTKDDVHVPDDVQSAVQIYVDDILPDGDPSAIGVYFTAMTKKFPDIDVEKVISDYRFSRKDV